jgi:hypothetical protein
VTEAPAILWKRLAIESPVIVLSILLAFAIDAWWNERGDRVAERLLLERLRADFTEISASLRLVEDEHREAAEACLFFMKLATGETVPATEAVDRRLAIVFLASRTFNPGTGATAFLSGNGTRLIRNRRLADRLIAWPGLVDELQEEEANLQKGVTERWTPFLSARVGLGPYLRPLGEAIPGLVDAAAVVAREPLLVDRDFHNQVADRFRWQLIALRDVEPVRAAVDDILQLIDDELEG